MIWELSDRFDPKSRIIADRHYNRQKIGSSQFVPPGRCMVLFAETETGRAIWVTSWPFAEYVKHAWAGAWVCSAFRNEGAGIASEMILEAVAATLAFFGTAPELGMITFVDRKKVRATMVRGEKVWGWSYRKAGFTEAGETKGGLLALQTAAERDACTGASAQNPRGVAVCLSLTTTHSGAGKKPDSKPPSA